GGLGGCAGQRIRGEGGRRSHAATIGSRLANGTAAGMAPKERIALMELTARIARAGNIAVLFTEHDMDVVFAHADRIIVLSRGKLIADGDARSIRDDPKVREVYFGTGKTFAKAGGP